MFLKKLVLIEFNKYHAEIIYSQLVFLKNAGYHVSLIGNIDNDFSDLVPMSDVVLQYDFNKPSSYAKSMVATLLYLYRCKPDVLILNTAQGPRALYFSLLYWACKPKRIGIFHNIQKFETSLGQRIIANRFKNAFVLADYIKGNFPQKSGFKCESFYASVLCSGSIHNIKPNGEFWVCIPGALELKRRDYFSLISDAPLASSIRFILLGRSNTEEGNQIKSLINEKQLNCRFIVFDGFVPDTIFNDYLFSSDIIMPLIHPNIKGFANYLKNKITGTMNIAYAFEKPMLYHQDLHLLPEFSNHGIPYEAATLFEKLNALAEGTIELPICKNVNQQEQREKYLAFIS